MTLNPDNDVYQGDLATLNAGKHAWAAAKEDSGKFRMMTGVVLVIGLAVIIYVMIRVRNNDTSLGQLPLHISIWITALVALFVNRAGKKSSEKPFDGFHMAHFEADDDTVYYQYQKGMSLRTYYIKDEDIRKIYRDDKANVILIEGDAKVNIQTRKGETEEDIKEFYALVPFDRYDLDDLLQPYKKKVKNVPGELRDRFSKEHL